MERTGACLCGGVQYRIIGNMAPPVACHCSQCARSSGNFAVTSGCILENLVFESAETLRWFKSSPEVERGFCEVCGSNLFWKSAADRNIYVAVGTINRPTRLELSEHIFVGSKSDFYQIKDGLPQKASV